MTSAPQENPLTSGKMSERLSRRRFFGALGASALGGLALSACGDSVTNNYYESSSTTPLDTKIRLYTWADYDDLELLAAWGDVDITVYGSNEELLEKLEALSGQSSFDIVVPTGGYIPELARRGLIQELDLTRIPNFRQLDKNVVDQPWDRNNTYSVCKSWGTIGWLYNTDVVKTPITSWAEFLEAAQKDASGRTAIIDTPVQIASLYFWAKNKNWNTDDDDELEKMSTFMLETIAPHISAVDGLPYNTVIDRDYALIQGYNGAIRSTLMALEEAGQDMSKWKWGVGGPTTEKYMDNWCIVKGARNLDAAYDFINFMLNPVNAARQASYIGSNTGTSSLKAMLTPETQYKDLIFFSDEEIKRMKAWEFNRAPEKLAKFVEEFSAKVNGGNLIKGG